MDSIDIDQFVESPDFHLGAIDETATSMDGGWLAGWALEKASGRPAAGLIIKSPQGAILLRPNTRREDLIPGFGPEAVNCGFKTNFVADIISPFFVANLKYYAFNNVNIITPLPVTSQNDFLSRIKLSTEADFFRLVQTPSTRAFDSKIVTHLSFHALMRSGDNHVLAAASACVLGYRLLENEQAAEQKRGAILASLQRLLAGDLNMPRGLYLRWHTSLRLVAGYLAFQSGNDAKALEHFSAIATHFIDLRKWPQALTNILIGVAISGYLQSKKGSIAAAIETWERAEEILRYGASVAEFQNFYAYGELTNAVQVAQFCYVAAMSSKSGGLINDVAVAPVNTVVDLSKIVGPFGKLAINRQKADLAYNVKIPLK